ncbi:MAG: carboxypeptidase-like regulatory domain-containing protein [Sphingobacteriaceae bacterium]|jgi:hypothetical protein
MSLTPKPKYCHQNWDAMTQTEKGRICGACDKLIFDFRKNTWNEIEKKQRESNNTTCGLYSDKQLKYWGQEPPVLDIEIKKSFIITSLFLSLLGLIPKKSKSQISSDTLKLVTERETYTSSYFVSEPNGIFIKGKLYDLNSKEGLPFASLIIVGSKKVVSTDKDGNYLFDITDIADSSKKYTVKAHYVGYSDNEVVYNQRTSQNITLDIPMQQQGTNFAVEVPKKKRFWKIRDWVRKN